MLNSSIASNIPASNIGHRKQIPDNIVWESPNRAAYLFFSLHILHIQSNFLHLLCAVFPALPMKESQEEDGKNGSSRLPAFFYVLTSKEAEPFQLALFQRTENNWKSVCIAMRLFLVAFGSSKLSIELCGFCS